LRISLEWVSVSENSFQALQSLAHSLFSGSSDDLVLHAALVENEQGGYGPHAVLLSQLFVVLHVNPGNFDRDGPVLGDGFKHQRHGLARVRPVGAKFNQHWVRGMEHFLVKVRFVQFNDVVVHKASNAGKCFQRVASLAAPVVLVLAGILVPPIMPLVWLILELGGGVSIELLGLF
jgi:hypothetical protein